MQALRRAAAQPLSCHSAAAELLARILASHPTQQACQLAEPASSRCASYHSSAATAACNIRDAAQPPLPVPRAAPRHDSHAWHARPREVHLQQRHFAGRSGGNSGRGANGGRDSDAAGRGTAATSSADANVADDDGSAFEMNLDGVSANDGEDALDAIDDDDDDSDASDDDNDSEWLYGGSDEEEEDHWEQYREVDAKHDDDRDDLDPSVPERRRALPADVREEAAEAAAAPLGPEEALEARQKRLQGDLGDGDEGDDGRGRAGEEAEALRAEAQLRAIEEQRPVFSEDGYRIPLRDVYEQKLTDWAAKVSGLEEYLSSREGRKLSRRERHAMVEEAGSRDDEQNPFVPKVIGHVVPRGPAQLNELVELGQWCMVVVDVKMTTTLTPQGKKQRYSAMVMTGNLGGKGGYGIGVSKDTNTAIMKALRFAILGAINIPLYRGHTVYFPSKSKYVRTKISIFPRPLDFGITASPILNEACELIGIRDITVKTHNSRNTRNVVKGFFQAVANIPTAAEVAQAKGVYMREVPTRRLSDRSSYQAR